MTELNIDENITTTLDIRLVILKELASSLILSMIGINDWLHIWC